MVEKIVTQMNLPKLESVDLLENIITILKQTLQTGEDVKIAGFGTFEVKQKKARRGRNPQTGDAIMIEPRRVLNFKPSTVLKKTINAQSKQTL